MPSIASNPNPATAPAGETAGLVSFTLQPGRGDEIRALCRRLVEELDNRSAVPVQLLAFGKLGASAVMHDELRGLSGRKLWPVTWVDGAACDDRLIAGIQVHAFSGDVEHIKSNGTEVGSVFTAGGARYCCVGGLTPADKTLSRFEQTRQTLETLQAILGRAGFDLADTVRTWFFLEDILSWYDDFNRARTEIYSGIKFCAGATPASTGVGAKNPAGTAVQLAAWAFRPLVKNSRAEPVASPLQCPAPAYGSAFSRALELSANTGQRLHVSGTASIAPDGKTLWTGDVRKQIELTMDVVEAMLRPRGFTYADVSRATAYFRRAADAAVFAQWLAAKQVPPMPVLSVQCDICRDDLLFEFEAEAERKI